MKPAENRMLLDASGRLNRGESGAPSALSLAVSRAAESSMSSFAADRLRVSEERSLHER